MTSPVTDVAVDDLPPVTQHPPIDLVMAKEAAALIGIAVQNLKPYDEQTKHGIRGLPAPVAEPEAGRIWYGPDIRAFAAHYRATRARRRVDAVADAA